MRIRRAGLLTRRAFLDAALRGAAGAAFLVDGGGARVAAQASPAGRLIVHSARPQDLETPAHLLTSWITPNELFYVRSHFYTPAIRDDMWRLHVDGAIDNPVTLTLENLRRMSPSTLPVTLECAGNGRGYFNPPVAGVQWGKGAVGNARWTGVRLADVLRSAGVQPSARFLWLDGADTGPGQAPDFIRSVPLDKALRGDTLLAYEMNGERLAPAHGFPLRAIVPGWEGAYSVKWLTRITVSERDHAGPFVSTAYRIPRSPVAPGTVVDAAQTIPIQGLLVKSIISSPAAGAALPRGRATTISGFAWSGEQDIARVDVSVDNGRAWMPATLDGERARYAWRQWTLRWVPDELGSHVLVSRATNAQGRTQPIEPSWNPGGYLWDAVDRVRVDVQPA